MNEANSKGTRDPVLKTLAILRRFMEEPMRRFGVRETASDMGLSPSSTHRLLTALAMNGYISRDENGAFSLSADVIRLANLVVSRIPIQEIARRHLKILWQTCNELVFFGTYSPERQEIFFNTHIESTQEFRYVVEPNKWVPVYAGASGLAVMAFLPDDERKSIIERTKLAPLTEHTLVDPDSLEDFLTNVRKAGYAYTRGQRIADAVGIAAPVFNADNKVVGSIALSLPAQRFDEKKLDQLIDAVVTCATNVSREVGGSV